MAKAYMVRHQHAGIVTSHVFANYPTPEQVASIVAECDRTHRPGGWSLVHEAVLLDAEVPVFAAQLTDRMSELSGAGTGSVVNPK